MMQPIKGLTLTQPWASLVALGVKQFETRSWSTSYRGWIAIHAAKRFPVHCRKLCHTEPFDKYFLSGDTIPLGKIVAIVYLGSSVKLAKVQKYLKVLNTPRSKEELAFGSYDRSGYAFGLDRVLRLPHQIKCNGALKLWDIPIEVIKEIETSLIEHGLKVPYRG